MAKIALTLDSRRPKENGTFPLVFRLSHNQKTINFPTGIDVRETEWDGKKRIIRSNFKGAESVPRLNNKLEKRRLEMTDILNKLEDKGELKYLDISQVKSKLDPSSNTGGMVFKFIEQLIKDLIASKRIGTARSYRCVLGIIKSFKQNRDIEFSAINLEFLKRLEAWHLSKEGNGVNSLAVYMRTIRAVYNKAIAEGIAEKDSSPFGTYRIRTTKPRKRAITLEAIKKIMGLDLTATPGLEYYRQVFLMSFYLQGMPFADLARLQVGNIIDSRVKYDRQKTDKPYDVKITPQLESILQNFSAGKSKDDYLLPVVKRQDLVEQYKDVLWAIQRYNKNLKKLASLAGIQENLTSYVARHSFASLADEMEIPLTGIRDMLGHEKAATTEAYLSDLRRTKVDEYQDRIFGGMS